MTCHTSAKVKITRYSHSQFSTFHAINSKSYNCNCFSRQTSGNTDIWMKFLIYHILMMT